MFVLGILPLGSHTLLEEMVVGLESQIGHGCNVVLRGILSAVRKKQTCILQILAYVDAPELLHRVEGNDFLQEIVPVVALI